MGYKDKLKEELFNLPRELRSRQREKCEDEFNEAFEQGYNLCMIKMLDLLMDIKLKDSMVIDLLRNHFDLRLSEAEDLIRTAKNRKLRREKETK